MHFEPAALGDLGDGADLGERVDGAEIARLGDVDRRGLPAMQLAWLYCRQGAGEGVGDVRRGAPGMVAAVVDHWLMRRSGRHDTGSVGGPPALTLAGARPRNR